MTKLVHRLSLRDYLSRFQEPLMRQIYGLKNKKTLLSLYNGPNRVFIQLLQFLDIKYIFYNYYFQIKIIKKS